MNRNVTYWRERSLVSLTRVIRRHTPRLARLFGLPKFTYIPVSKLTEDERAHRNRLARERNRLYYARKKGYIEPYQRELIIYTEVDKHAVLCAECREEKVTPICGFCQAGIPVG